MFTLAPTTRRPLRRETASFTAAALVARASHLIRELRLRRAIRAMQDLDDGMLHDVGLTRDGIEDAVRHGRAVRPV